MIRVNNFKNNSHGIISNMYNRAGRLKPITSLLFLQMQTNALKEHTAVVLMLSVRTSRDPTNASASMDFLGMEYTALVTIGNTVRFNASLASLVKQLDHFDKFICEKIK